MPVKEEINLVLSSGAARGLAHIGVLSVLEKHFKINSIIGTSMGAIVGGFYSYGYTPQEMVELTKQIQSYKILSVLKPSLRKSGLLAGNTLFKYFLEKTKNINIENCKIPFAAIAFDLNSTSTIIMNKGNLAKALRASSAIPSVFEPVQDGNYLFVDGYIEHPFPLHFANHYGKKTVVGASAFPLLPMQSSEYIPPKTQSYEKIPGLFEVLMKATLYNQGSMSLNAIFTYKPDIYISCFAKNLDFWELDEVDDFFAIGQKAAQKAVEDYFKDKDKTLHKKFLSNLADNYDNILGNIKKKQPVKHKA